MRSRLEHLRREEGASMVEVLLVMVLLGIVSGAFLANLGSMQGSVALAENRSRRNDEIRLALSQLDREIRSGNVFYDPALENDPALGTVPNFAVRVYTQANAPRRDPGNQCAQWRIHGTELQTRMWGKDDMTPKPWRVVATDIVNRTLPTPVPAFVLDPTPEYGKRTMQVTFVVDRADDEAKPEEMRVSITGRNTQYTSYGTGVCAQVPPVA